MNCLRVAFIWTQEWLLVAAYLTHHLAIACESGWFGGLCQFQCHCSSGLCDNRGECIGGKCADGYFGPACQYVDLVYNFKTAGTEKFLYDHNDTSCNNELTASRVDVNLTKTFRFSWMRLIARVSVKEYDFLLVLNGSEQVCTFERDYYVDNITVDVTCDTTALINQVSIIGRIASDICGIYVSGGREVALKQLANQTSTQGAQTANNAVDGLMEGRQFLTSCSATKAGVDNQWIVRFSRPHLLFRIGVHGSISPQHALKSVDIFTLSESRVRLNTYLNYPCVQSFCELTLESTELSAAVVIKGRTSGSLALCSVRVFGETICPDGTFGLECLDKCRCDTTELCNLVTGVCTSGCQGYFGYQCDKLCGVSCAGANCFPRFGDCVECYPGYSGQLCTDVCSDGKYGASCLYECSKECLNNMCDKISGICLSCPVGRKGPFCKELDDTDYGVWPYVVVALSCVIFLLCCLCLRRTKIQQNEAAMDKKSRMTVPEYKVKQKKIRQPTAVEIETAV